MMWLKKSWNNVNNKDLCRVIISDQKRFNLTPAAVYNLDRVGLNELEIMNLDNCLGMKVGDLPTAEVDMLNMLETQYNILFNGNEKLAYAEGKMKLTTLLNKPLESMLYNKMGNNWHGSALLYSKNTRDYFLKQQAA